MTRNASTGFNLFFFLDFKIFPVANGLTRAPLNMMQLAAYGLQLLFEEWAEMGVRMSCVYHYHYLLKL